MKNEKRNWKRRLKRVGIGFLIIASVLLLTNAFLNWRAGSRLQAKLEQLRAADEATGILELAPQHVADDKNAAVMLSKAKKRLQNFSNDYQDFLNTPLGNDYQRQRDLHKLPLPEQVDEIEAMLAEHREILELVHQASKLQLYAPQLDFSTDKDRFLQQLIDNASLAKSSARLLMLQMQVSIVRGQPDDAVSIGIDLLRLSRLYEQEPAIVNYLIAIACRQIACAELSHAVRQESLSKTMRDQLDIELDQQSGLHGLEKALRDERAIGLDAMAAWRREIPGRIVGWRFTNWQSDLIDYYDRLFPIVATPWHIGRSKLSPFKGDYPTVIELLLPAVQSSYDAASRDIATQRCLRILNELGRYKLLHNKEATGLSSLTVPPGEGIDPFTGNSLLVKQKDEGWHVYTAFKNGKDDGGSYDEQLDWGLSP